MWVYASVYLCEFLWKCVYRWLGIIYRLASQWIWYKLYTSSNKEMLHLTTTSADETLNWGPLALLLRQQYEFPFGINTVQFSISISIYLQNFKPWGPYKQFSIYNPRQLNPSFILSLNKISKTFLLFFCTMPFITLINNNKTCTWPVCKLQHDKTTKLRRKLTACYIDRSETSSKNLVGNNSLQLSKDPWW